MPLPVLKLVQHCLNLPLPAKKKRKKTRPQPRWAAKDVDMLIKEMASASPDKLAAVAKFLMGRAEDTNATKKININSFLNIASSLGINITASQLRDLSQQPPLNGLIQNIDGDNQTGEVVFKGAQKDPTQMPVDQANKTVSKMAKRAAAKGA